jgi:hypothetical protein
MQARGQEVIRFVFWRKNNLFVSRRGAWGNLGPPEYKKKVRVKKVRVKKKLKSEKSNNEG